MQRYLICSLILAAFLCGLNWALNGAFKQLGFGAGAAIGIGFCVLVVIAAFSWDHYEKRSRSQQ